MENLQPLVSVVTPVYNGASYLDPCIESVLSQAYENWEYIVVDNRSTDDTRKIATRYAAKDSRIKVLVNDQHLPLLSNWNYALRQISSQAKYCKIVHADDLIFPDCISAMVEVAEKYPKVGIVGAYRIEEDCVSMDELAYPSPITPGREICRSRLMGGPDLFGSPTSLLIRAELIRQREKFYDESDLHADTAVCFELLKGHDYGFVHEVLTFTRRHNESVSSFAKTMNTKMASRFVRFLKYGHYFLNDSEYAKVGKQAKQSYYRFVGGKLLQALMDSDFRKRRKEYFNYHRTMLADAGHTLNFWRAGAAAVAALYNRAHEKLRIT